MDFYPAAIQVRWFQGQQELSEHVVATDVVPNGDWTYQLLVLLETPPRRGLTYSCQVEHVSLEQPLSRHWGTGEPLGALAEPLGCAGSHWEGAGESRAGTGRGPGGWTLP
ncbi:class II histocompatibility antigen, B-L beta chain-like [Molothrus ater]|uniref:class II histocompatibility antigen, B-L beta chain-like n=1 Tax=Molothrus ater TaxID=84834 RepID=UPI0023E8F7A3|nr:class II histocompatibility antigen, B-L beta chain-like [Molothrus ater]